MTSLIPYQKAIGGDKLRRPETERKLGYARFHVTALTLLTAAGAMCGSADALEPNEIPYVKADGSRTSSLEQAAQSWRNDEEFRKMSSTNGLGQINAEYAYARGITGLGVKVGVFDTGVYGKHPEFDGAGKLTGLSTAGRYAYTYKNYYRAGDRFSFKGDDPLNGTGIVQAQYHGTHVAGIIAANRDGARMHGVAFNAQLVAAMNSDAGPEDGVVAGNDANAYSIGFAALRTSGVRIINNSWGIGFLGSLGTSPSRRASQSDTMQQYFSAPGDGTMNAADGVARSGILFVKSAGNKFGSQPDALGALPYFRPDLEKNWITVANLSGEELDDSSSICGMSKYYCASAPGTSIYSTSFVGNKTSNTPGYKTLTGTSMAAPMVSGSLALLMERFPYMSGEAIRDTLLTTARDLGSPGVDKTYGWGLIDIGAAMRGPGQFLGPFGVSLPAGQSDIWSNDISDAAIRVRRQDDLNEIASLKRQAERRTWADGDRIDDSQLAQLNALVETHEVAAKTRGKDALTGATYVGSLEKRGDGTLVLAGRNTYTGSTWVRSGRLVLNGSITSDTTVDGSGVGLVSVNPTTQAQEVATQAGTFVVEASGTAAGVTVRQGGTAMIKGQAGDVNAGMGGTAIIDGQVGNVAAAGGAAVINGRSGDVTATAGGSALIAGRSGDVAAHDGGSVTISGQAGNVSAGASGTAIINGYAGNVTAGAGSFLGGSGTLASLSALSGSVVAPGNSIGTMNVSGPIVFAPGATYRVEISRDGRSDLIATTGAAQLDGGLVTVSMERSPTLLNLRQGWSILGRRFTILDARDGVKGRFKEAAPSFVFLNTVLDYSQQAVGLTMERSATSFDSAGVNTKQRRVGAAVEALGLGNPVFEAVLTLPDAESARAAFQALSADASPAVTANAASTAYFLRETLSGRSRWTGGTTGMPTGAAPVVGHYSALGPNEASEADPTPSPPANRYGLWGQAFGTYGRTGSTADAGGTSHRVGGFVIGADGLLDNGLKLGAAAGLAKTSVRSTGTGPAAEISSPFVSLYGGYDIGRFSLQFGGVYTDNTATARRNVSLPGFFNSLTSKGRSASLLGFGEFGYKLAVDQQLTLSGPVPAQLTLAYVQPYLGLGYTQIRSDRYAERGGVAALMHLSNTSDIGDMTIGVKAEAQLDLGLKAPIALRGLIGYRRNYGDLTLASNLAFSGGTPFRSSGSPLDRQALVTEAGLDLRLARNVDLTLTYAGQFSKNSLEHTGKGSLTYRW